MLRGLGWVWRGHMLGIGVVPGQSFCPWSPCLPCDLWIVLVFQGCRDVWG